MANSLEQAIKNMELFSKNMCVVCKHDKYCMSPIHGKFTGGYRQCPYAEPVSEVELLVWAWRDIYGITKEEIITALEAKKCRKI